MVIINNKDVRRRALDAHLRSEMRHRLFHGGFVMKGGVVRPHDAAGAIFGKGEKFLHLLAQRLGHRVQEGISPVRRQDEQHRGAHGAAAFFENGRDALRHRALHQV